MTAQLPAGLPPANTSGSMEYSLFCPGQPNIVSKIRYPKGTKVDTELIKKELITKLIGERNFMITIDFVTRTVYLDYRGPYNEEVVFDMPNMDLTTQNPIMIRNQLIYMYKKQLEKEGVVNVNYVSDM